MTGEELPPDPNPSSIVQIYGLAGRDGRIRYIGRTGKTLVHRLQRHCQQARSGGSTCAKRISVWIREQEFQIAVVPLEVVPREIASRSEWEWIQKFKSDGVQLVNEQGFDWSPSAEQRAIISETNRKRFESPSARARIARISREREFTAEEREAMSLRAKGRRHTDVSKAKMSAARKGVPKSAETRARMSLAQQKRKAEGGYGPLSEEHRKKISAATKGRPKSQEHKRKIAEGHRRRREGGDLG